MSREPRFLLPGLVLALVGAAFAPRFAHAEEDDNAMVAPSLITQVNVPTDATASKATTLQLKTGILARGLDDEYQNSKYAGAALGLKGTQRLGDYFSARLNMTYLMTSGAATNLYSSAGKPPNANYVNEAALTFKPIDSAWVEMGVILAQFSTMPSNFDSNGFPALRETYEFGGEDVRAHVFAMQALPTSQTVAIQSTDTGKVTELLIYGVNFTTDARDLNRLSFSGSLLSYDFRNLNASAATDGFMLGNTVTPAGSQYKFLYDFQGYEAGAGASYRLGHGWKASLNGAYITNQQAPTGDNKGYLYTAGMTAPVMKTDVTLTGGYFYDDPDVLPASYMGAGTGSNDRFGQVVRLSIEDKKQRTKGFLQYTKANTIESRPYLADREIFSMGLEVSYDIL